MYLKSISKAALIILLIGISSLSAGWMEECGIVVCPAISNSRYPRIVPDGEGGIVITWEYTNDNDIDIHAQRISSNGEALWTEEGNYVCSITENQRYPVIISDGTGGAIIAWEDSGILGDIYAQRLDGLGSTMWTVNGVVVCNHEDFQRKPLIVTDGAGGAIIAWDDHRAPSYRSHVYAQRIDANGYIRWSSSGVKICESEAYQYDHDIVSDGSGGAVIVWSEARSGSNDIYAQRINASGNIMWESSGVAICTAEGHQRAPDITADLNGGTNIVWRDERANEEGIYAQRLDASGIVQWMHDGLCVCNMADSYGEPRVLSDGTSGVIVTWHDDRYGDLDIYAQKIDTSGAIQWVRDGITVCMAPDDQTEPEVASDGSGGALISWFDHRTYADICVQRVNEYGHIQWSADGVPLSHYVPHYYGHSIASDGNNGGFIVWGDYSTGAYRIGAQRIDAEGIYCWTSAGISICPMEGKQHGQEIVSNGSSGAIVVWEDHRGYGYSDYTLYTQEVNAEGYIQWEHGGVCVYANDSIPSSAEIITDGSGGAIISWVDRRDGNLNIYSQKVSSGAVQWLWGGVAVCTALDTQQCQQMISDGAGGAIIVWEDNRAGNRDIYAQRVKFSASVDWEVDGVPVVTATEDQIAPQIIPDGTGCAIIIWQDYRNGNGDIYAQRIDENGTLLWTPGGEAICTNVSEQVFPCLVSDGAYSAVIIWQDYRNGNIDIYAQRIGADGTNHWNTNGVVVCAEAADQINPQIASCSSGGAIITWEDNRSGNSDIYAQNIDATGNIMWTTNGVAVCTSAGDHISPRIDSDGYGGVLITWQDNRSGNTDIYAQRLSADGQLYWDHNGVELCTAKHDQIKPQIVSDGYGGAIVVWEDYRLGEADIHANSVNYDGLPKMDTFLKNHYVRRIHNEVEIFWELSTVEEIVFFHILRAEDKDIDYIELPITGVVRDGLTYSYVDESCTPGKTYSYRVDIVDGDSRHILFETKSIFIPAATLTLHQNYPNPFNPSTTISFTLPQPENVRLSIFDVEGKLVRNLVNMHLSAGYKKYSWDGKDSRRNAVVSGIYFYRLKAGKRTLTKKMVVLR